jgi:hypothetical protein
MWAQGHLKKDDFDGLKCDKQWSKIPKYGIFVG